MERQIIENRAHDLAVAYVTGLAIAGDLKSEETPHFDLYWQAYQDYLNKLTERITSHKV